MRVILINAFLGSVLGGVLPPPSTPQFWLGLACFTAAIVNSLVK